MLTNGIQMTLLMGPVVVVPAPRLVMDAIDSVKVITAAGKPSGFELSFQFNSKSDLNQFFLIAGITGITPLLPALRVMLIVTINGTPQSLFDGVMTRIDMQPAGPGGQGKLTVFGKDLTRVMNTIIATADQIAADAFGCTLIGQHRDNLPYLKMGHERKLGTMFYETLRMREV
jgi:hypothetical protein